MQMMAQRSETDICWLFARFVSRERSALGVIRANERW